MKLWSWEDIVIGKVNRAGCQTGVDLGCGVHSLLSRCGLRRTLGVDAFQPYLDMCRANHVHSDYLQANVQDLKLNPSSFDVVLASEVIEHLPRAEGEAFIRKAEGWARKLVIFTTPNGFLRQSATLDNEKQSHLSGWTVEDFRSRGFRVYGMSGIKYVLPHWRSTYDGSMPPIPAALWFASSLPVAVIPSMAFQILAIKEVAHG